MASFVRASASRPSASTTCDWNGRGSITYRSWPFSTRRPSRKWISSNTPSTRARMGISTDPSVWPTISRYSGMSRGVASKTVTCIGGMAGASLLPQPANEIVVSASAGISRIGVSLDRAFIASTFLKGTPLPRLAADETPCTRHPGKDRRRRIAFFMVDDAADRAINNAVRSPPKQPLRQFASGRTRCESLRSALC